MVLFAQDFLAFKNVVEINNQKETFVSQDNRGNIQGEDQVSFGVTKGSERKERTKSAIFHICRNVGRFHAFFLEMMDVQERVDCWAHMRDCYF